MQIPHGPHIISQNGQVVIPKALMSVAQLSPGDSVYLAASDSDDGTIILIPAALATEWFQRGRDGVGLIP